MVIGAATVLLLTGCASTPESAPPTTAAAASTPTPSADPALKMCELLNERMLEYPDYVTAVMGGEYDQIQHRKFVEWADNLTNAAPANAASTVTDYVSPIRQIEEVVLAGGGELVLSTDSFKTGALEILEYCVDAGYKAD